MSYERTISMRPSGGNPGKLVRETFSLQERAEALDTFYRRFAGGAFHPAFRMEANAALKASKLR